MHNQILMVDKDIKISDEKQAECNKYGVSAVRVDTMRDAIEKLEQEHYYLILINAGNVSYLPLLKTMSDIASFRSTRILVFDSSFTSKNQVRAFHNGADEYVPLSETFEDNLKVAIAYSARCNEREHTQKKRPEIYHYQNFLLLPYSRQIFYNDKKLDLTKMEYEVLNYFIINHDQSLSYSQIYQRVWGEGADNPSHKYLWNFINCLRKKLKKSGSEQDYFKTERGFGYRFTAWADK